jgi:uracil-DNA glycosylase family 4
MANILENMLGIRSSQDDYGMAIPGFMKKFDSRYVPGDGSLTPEVVIIGEAPGNDENITGVPFVGASGRMLKAMLTHAGYKKDRVYYTNVIKYQPLNNDQMVYSRDPKRKRWSPGKEWWGWQRLLIDEIDILKPKLIIALGGTAAYALTKQYGITRIRGSVYESLDTVNSIPVLCSVHPAFVIRGMYGLKPFLEMDLKRGQRIIGGDSWRPSKKTFTTAKNIDHVEELCARYARDTRLACDIESRGKYISLVGFARSATEGFNIEIIAPSGASRWETSEEIRVWKAIQYLLTRDSVEYVYQNGWYDRAMFARHGIHSNPTHFDTMIGFKIAYPEFRKGLNIIASVYTKEPYYKDDRKVAKELNEEGSMTKRTPWQTFLDYNLKDCCVTWDASVKIEKDLATLGLKDHYINMSKPLAEACHKANISGFKVDLAKRDDLNTRGVKLINGYRKTVEEACGMDINIRSTNQCKEALERMGFGKVASTGRLAMLKLLQKRPGDRALHAMLSWRRLIKFVGDYVNAQLDFDNRLRFTLASESTETGRPASRKSCHNTGFNICATPRNVAGNPLAKEFRDMIIADEGKVLIVADQEQAESRMTAGLARCPAMLKVFSEGRDFHCYAGGIFFEKPEEEIEKGSLERDVSKAGGHALNYGMQAQRMSDEILKRIEIFIEKSTCNNIRNRYHAAHPEIREEYWEYVNSTITKTRTLLNPLGRRRFFNGRQDRELLQEAYGWIQQSTSGDITNFAIAVIEKSHPWIEFKLHTYDGLVVQVDEDRIDEACRIITDLLEIELDYRGIKLVIPSEVKVGKSWGQATVWTK